MNKLAHADGGRVAVAGDANRRHGVVGHDGAGGDGRHAPMHAVEAERTAHEVGRALGRAADAAHLHHPLRLDAHLEEGVDDALGDSVVAATGAERALAAAIIEDGKADVIHFGSCSSGCHLQALLMNKFFRDGFRVHRHSVVMENAAQLDHLISGKIELEQAG